MKKEFRWFLKLNLHAKYTNATIVGITGSNGKTTTATLTHHILKQELEVGLAGNIGRKFCKADFRKGLSKLCVGNKQFSVG